MKDDRYMDIAILQGDKVVPINLSSPREFKLYQDFVALPIEQSRKINESKVSANGIEVKVSTVFLTTNHASFRGRDLWFETMTFSENESLHQICYRYETIEEAREGHLMVVKKIEKELKKRSK